MAYTPLMLMKKIYHEFYVYIMNFTLQKFKIELFCVKKETKAVLFL